MPTGAWIVERWVIRMPVARRQGIARAASRPSFPERPATPTGAHSARRDPRGGWGGDRDRRARRAARSSRSEVASVRGTVFDSTRMAPLGNARVFLDGTQFSARSGADGAFAIEQVPPGTYALSVAHPRFDSLNGAAPSANVAVARERGNESHSSLAHRSRRSSRAIAPRTTARAAGACCAATCATASAAGPAIEAHVLLTWNRLESASGKPYPP